MTWLNSDTWLRRRHLPLWAAVCAAALLGVAQAASLAWWSDGEAHWWLQLLALAGFLTLLQAQTLSAHPENQSENDPQRGACKGRPVVCGFVCSWAFATAWQVGIFWWLFISMNTYGGLSSPLAALAVLALGAFLALYYVAVLAAYQWLLRWLARHKLLESARAAWWGPVIFASLWTLAEWARGTWLTGFPWGAIGYSHIDSPLVSVVPWVGVYGMGWLAAWCSAALAALLMRRYALLADAQHERRAGRQIAVASTQLMAVCGVLAACGALNVMQTGFTKPTGEVRAALLQGNIAQDEKFEFGPGINRSLQWYGEHLLRAEAPLVVTAETAIPLLPSQLPEGYLEALRAPFEAKGSGRVAIVAIPLGSVTHGYTNSVLAFREGAEPYQYHKHHLVPFGEFIPNGFRWFVRMMDIPLGDFNRGDLPQPPLVWQGERIAPNICYEDLFGEEIGAGFRSEADAPTILLNLSNIGWFGDTVAIDQHLAISRMRAIEFERPMLRATNTGATAFIDHTGRVVKALPRLTEGVLDVTVQGRSGRTPYAVWVSQWGLWPLVAACVLLLALGALVFRAGRWQERAGRP